MELYTAIRYIKKKQNDQPKAGHFAIRVVQNFYNKKEIVLNDLF